jgi:hypothetical protein
MGSSPTTGTKITKSPIRQESGTFLYLLAFSGISRPVKNDVALSKMTLKTQF